MMTLMSKKMRWMAGVLICAHIFVPVNAEETSEVLADNVLRINLEQAIKIALSDNPTIIVAGQEIEVKKTTQQEALYNLLPSADISVAYQNAIKKQKMALGMGEEVMEIEMGRTNTINTGLAVSLPIYAPALYQSIKMTQTDIELAVEKSRASKLDMINQVTKAYYQLLLTQDSYDVLQKSFAQAEANFNVVNEMYKLGSVSEYDKIRADVQVRSLRPNVVSARNGIDLAKLQMKVLLGLDKDMDIEIEGNLKDYESQMSDRNAAAGSLNFANNSDLKQLDLNSDMLEHNVNLQIANFKPTIGAQYSYSYMTMNDNYKLFKYDWIPYSSVALSVNIPLFKASNFPKVKKAKIQIAQLKETRVNVERMLHMQASAYLNNMSASSEQLVSNKEGVLQAEKGRVIAQKRYEVGKGTILELNDSEVALTHAQLVYNQSIFDYIIAKADLDKVLGKELIN